MAEYRRRYDRDISFYNTTGDLVLFSAPGEDANEHRMADEQAAYIKHLIATRQSNGSFTREGITRHLNIRYIPELSWHLVVQQAETRALKYVFRALIANLLICAFVTAGILFLSHFILSIFQRRLQQMAAEEMALRRINQDQADAIAAQNRELSAQNLRLQTALADVKKLSGLLPICASCKKIRDDRGYWKRIESYIQEHSEAEFSHGICPECAQKLYPHPPAP